MTRYWTSYWRGENWLANTEYSPVEYSGGNQFKRRGIVAGDIVYIVSIQHGHLYLGGKMQVGEIISREEAVRRRRRKDLYDANEWLAGKKGTGSPLNLHRRLTADLARELRFISRSGPERLRFKGNNPDNLDGQTLRAPRELSRESATSLDRIIEITDGLPRDKGQITVSRDLLNQWSSQVAAESFHLPDEIVPAGTYEEGSVKQIFVNRYERDAGARAACLLHYGTRCSVCDLDFPMRYGQAADGLIHIHHLVPLAEIGASYSVDPVKDLRPVCPNCHAVIHRREPPYSIEEVQDFIHSEYKIPMVRRGKFATKSR